MITLVRDDGRTLSFNYRYFVALEINEQSAKLHLFRVEYNYNGGYREISLSVAEGKRLKETLEED